MKRDTVSCPLCRFDNPADTFFCGKCGTRLGLESEPQASKTMTMMAQAPHLERGKLFAGRYEVIEQLGRGGMGSVYRVEDQKVREEVALKLINPEIVRDPKVVERFRQELKVARQISHRNVCRMYDLGEAEGSHYITMEYVPGEDLRSLLKRIGRLPEDKALAIARQVADGLAEAHHRDVVHRDLKPGNIMVDREGNAKIMDFGIARSAKAKGVTAAGLIVGTPDYMSPEQAEAKDVDGRADIYSLGVILYEMTTGTLPFEGETALAVAMKHKSEAPRDPREINPQVSVALSRLILKCLEKDRGKRFSSASELGAEIRAIEGTPTAGRMNTARKTLTPKTITVTFKLRRVAVPAAAVLVLAALGFVLFRVRPKPGAAERSVAVISFQNQTGDAAYDYLRSAIPNLLITSLEQSKHLQVTTFERLRDLLRQAGKTEPETIDRDLGFELCAKDDVEALVLGSFVKAGETFATDVKIFDVKTRRLVKSFTAQGAGAQSILDKQIGELSRQISRGVGLSKRTVEETATQMAKAPTASMDAYKFYLAGHEKYQRFYYDEARKDLEKAVELDPGFAAAYYDLSRVTFDQGDMVVSREALKKAKETAGRAPEKERLFIEAYWATRREGDSEKRLRILQEIAAKYPKEKEVHLDLSRAYSKRKMYPEALAEADAALALDPEWSAALNTLGFVYFNAGDPVKAEDTLKKQVALSPTDPNPLDSLAFFYYQTGRLDDAVAFYKRALQVKPDYGGEEILSYVEAVRGNYREALDGIDQFILASSGNPTKARGYCWRAVYDYLAGRRAKARSEMERFGRFSASDKSPVTSTLAPYWMAFFSFEDGDYDEALRSLSRGQEQILGYFRGGPALPFVEATMAYERDIMEGFAAAREGRLEDARRKVDDAAATWPKSASARLFRDDPLEQALVRLRAEVLLLEGKPAEAVALIDQRFETPILGYGPNLFLSYLFLNFPLEQDVVPRAFEKMGRIDQAIDAYRKLLDFDPKGKDRRLHVPVYHDRLAKLYEAKGMADAARAEYQKLVDDWKDADPGIVELRNARKRLETAR